MSSRFSDPILLACAGILLVGFLFLIVALQALFRRQGSGPAQEGLDLSAAPGREWDERPDAPAAGGDVMAESLAAARARPAPVPPPVVNKEVADRLEAMSQRLVEMQNVLARQTSAGAAAGVGQGFSAETIDKLLKIIGNVIQQVDVLQKSLGPGASKPGAIGAPPANPAASPGPTSRPVP